MRRVHVLVAPSTAWRELRAVILLEAMASETLVVASDMRVIARRRAFRHAVHAGDDTSLEHAIDRALRDETPASIAQAKAHANGWSMSTLMDRYQDLYSSARERFSTDPITLRNGHQATLEVPPLEFIARPRTALRRPGARSELAEPLFADQRRKARESKGVVRAFALRKKLPESVGVAIVVVVLIAGVVVVPWLPLVGIAIAFCTTDGTCVARWCATKPRVTSSVPCGRSVQGRRHREGSPPPHDGHGPTGRHLRRRRRQHLRREPPRLQRRARTEWPGPLFFVTDALMRDFELIELKGVVAHCLARHRLGLLCARASRPSPSRTTNHDARWPVRDWPTAPTRSRPRPFATRRGWPRRCASARASNSRAPRSSPAPRTRSGVESGSTSGVGARAISSTSTTWNCAPGHSKVVTRGN